MPINIVTYTYHAAAEGNVRDFVNGPALLNYCAGNLNPLVLTPIDAEDFEDFLDECVADGSISDDHRRAVIDWLKSVAPDKNTLIGVLES